MENLKKRLNEISKLEDADMEAFSAKWQYFDFPKNHVILKEGEIGDFLYFIKKGLVRLYYMKDGKEITEWIAIDNNFFVSTLSFFSRQPSRLTIHALEPTEVVAIHNDDLEAICRENHAVEHHIRQMMVYSVNLAHQRIEDLQFEPAQQRYDKLMLEHSDFIQRVNLGYIASFLGITQETLSRIRGKN
jgi:CRP-like cAMP-binding protein